MLVAAPTLPQAAGPDPATFDIVDTGSHNAAELRYLRSELMHGLAVLDSLGFHRKPGAAPIRVIARGGSGIAHVNRNGDIVLFWLREDRSPILHELTHVVAGYDRSAGHWSAEGLASWVQDRHGNNRAYPTFRQAPGLIRLLHDDDELLPMAEILADRNRAGPFGNRDAWSRWRAYAQSTSFVGFLLARNGIESFRKVYNQPIETADFTSAYGEPVDALVTAWRARIASGKPPSDATRKQYARMKANLRVK